MSGENALADMIAMFRAREEIRATFLACKDVDGCVDVIESMIDNVSDIQVCDLIVSIPNVSSEKDTKTIASRLADTLVKKRYYKSLGLIANDLSDVHIERLAISDDAETREILTRFAKDELPVLSQEAFDILIEEPHLDNPEIFDRLALKASNSALCRVACKPNSYIARSAMDILAARGGNGEPIDPHYVGKVCEVAVTALHYELFALCCRQMNTELLVSTGNNHGRFLQCIDNEIHSRRDKPAHG